MLAILFATATAKNGFMPKRAEHLNAPVFQEEEKMDDLAALAELGEDEAGDLLAWPFPQILQGGEITWPWPTHTKSPAKQATEAVAKDLESLVADVGPEQAGEIIPQLLCNIPFVGQVLCGGRRRMNGAEWEALLSEQHDMQALVKDVEKLVDTVGAEEAGEIIPQLLCNIPFVGQVLCGGRRRAMASEWETVFAVMHAKEAITEDVATLVSDLGEEQAGEIIPQLLCNIPFVGQVLCGGRRRAYDPELALKILNNPELIAQFKLVYDMEKLIDTLGEDQAGEIIPQFLCSIPIIGDVVCGRGRRRAEAPEWETMFAVAHAKNAVAEDVKSLVADMGEEEAGEIIPQLLCNIPFVGQVLCGGRRRVTDTQWEHMKHMIATEQDKQALVKDVEQLVNTVGVEEAGEVLPQLLCSIPFVGQVLCGGRRRATLEAAPEFAVVEDVATLMSKLSNEDKMLVGNVLMDQETLLHSMGEHEAGEIVGNLLCSIPFVGSILCGGGRRRATLETAVAKDVLANDVKSLMTKLDGEDKNLVAKLFVDEAVMLKAVGHDEAAEGVFTALIGAGIAALPGLITSIGSLFK